MARQQDDRPRKRFSRSGHTSHAPRLNRSLRPRRRFTHRSNTRRSTRPVPAATTAAVPPAAPYPPPGQYPPPLDPYGNPTYHHVAQPTEQPQKPPASPAVAITKAAFTQTNRAARVVTRKVISASKADGASESGLTQLIWNQVLSYGTDAMITVALAGTVFFGASTARPARQHPALPADHDGAVRRGRPGHRPGPRPAAARAALDDGGHRDRPGDPGPDHGQPPDRPVRPVPVCARLAGAVEGLRGGARRRGAAPGAARAEPHRGQRPPVDLRARLDAGRGRFHRRGHQAQRLLQPGPDAHRGRVRRVRVLRVPAAAPGRLGRRRAAPPAGTAAAGRPAAGADR